MEWLWLFLFLFGLGAMWLAIWGIEKLIRHVKLQDETRRQAERVLHERIEREESDFIKVRAAKDYLESAQASQPTPNGEIPEEFKNAMTILTPAEVLDSMVKKAFGEESDQDGITAERSAFDVEPAKVAIAKGNGVIPVKAKSSRKSPLSKSEQKIYKKIKRGA